MTSFFARTPPEIQTIIVVMRHLRFTQGVSAISPSPRVFRDRMILRILVVEVVPFSEIFRVEIRIRDFIGPT